MDRKPAKKTLHLKLALIVFVGISIPVAVLFVTGSQFFAAIAGLLSFCLALVETFLVLKPLGQFLKGVDSLGDGNLNFRLDIRSKDEFEDAAEAFNNMAQKLAGMYQKEENDKYSLLNRNNRLESVLASIIDGVIAVDTSKNIVFANKAAEYLTGFTNPEMEGKSVDQFIHLFNEDIQVPSKTFCQKDFNQKLMLVDKNGKQQKVNVAATLTNEETHANLSCILIMHDLSREQELEQMKLDFVSMASHELKTPLTNIIGYLSVFIDENKTKVPAAELELLDRSLVSAKGLFSLIENLLSVNKIEREQLSVIVQPADYQPVLDKAMEDSQNLAKLKNITLTFHPSQTPIPKVLLDPMRVGEVLNNLISNAIKYTPAGGKVDVSIEVTPTEVVTTVADTGMGIPAEALPRLFSKFFRVSNAIQKAEKGTGLGLFIAKSIIEKLNGKIWVESELDKGSKFHFSLPTVAQSRIHLDEERIVSETIQSGGLNFS